MRFDSVATTHHESPRGTVQYAAGDKWFFQHDHASDQPPLALAGAFPSAARPEGWARPVARPVLDAIRVVATQYKSEPAWRIEFPVDTMREQTLTLTFSPFAPPLRSIIVGRDDHLPRAWTGYEDKNASHATYTWRRAPRPYTADEMAFHPAPGMLEVGYQTANGRTVGVVKGNAPDFSLKSALGKVHVQLSHLRGRPVLLIFKANPAALEIARAFYRDLHGKGLAVLVVTDEPSTVRKALPKGGVPFPVLADKDGKVSAPYGAGDADIVLIGKDGAVSASGRLADDVPRFRALLKAAP
jgi:hypothetical protein